MNLLAALEHEVGRRLGFEHEAGSVMAETLSPDSADARRACSAGRVALENRSRRPQGGSANGFDRGRSPLPPPKAGIVRAFLRFVQSAQATEHRVAAPRKIVRQAEFAVVKHHVE